MRSVLVLAVSITPLLSVVGWQALPGQADSRSFTLAELPPLPSIDQDIDRFTLGVLFRAGIIIAGF